MLKKRLLPTLIVLVLVMSSVGIPAVFAADAINFGDVNTLFGEDTIKYNYTLEDINVGADAEEHDASGENPRCFTGITDIDKSAGTTIYNADFTIQKDAVTGDEDNNAVLIDFKYGMKKISDADKALCTETLTFTGTTVDGQEKEYTYKVIPELKTNDKGKYYRGYRSDNESLWCGVYVKDDGSVDESTIYSYTALPNILEDGSPLLSADKDGRARAASFGFYQSGSVNKIRSGGICTIGLRFGMKKNNDEEEAITEIASDFVITVDGYGYNFNKSGIGASSSNSFAKIKRANGEFVNAPATTWVGKTADTNGIFNNTDNLEKITERKPGEWAEVLWVFERETETATLYYNGKPVFWKVSKTGETDEYSSVIQYTHGSAVPNIVVNADRGAMYIDQEYMVDDFVVKYMSAEELAESIIENIGNDYNKVAEEGSGLFFERIGSYVSYTSTSDKVVFDSANKNVATVNPSLGSGVDVVTVTVTATLHDYSNVNQPIEIKETETYEIALNQKSPYEVNAVNVVKDDKKVFTPADGAVIKNVSISKNIDDAANVFVAAYNSANALVAVKKVEAVTGNVLVDLDLTGAAYYKVFVFDTTTIQPYTKVKNSLPAAGQAVKMYLLGGVELGDSFTTNVTVDTTYNTASAKEALKNGGLNNALTQGTAGDYVVIALSQKDIADATVGEYEVLLTQIVKAAQKVGMIPVIITNNENASYVAKAASVAEATNTAHINGDDIAAQMKTMLLPVGVYVK